MMKHSKQFMEHIEYAFAAFCKIVLRNAAISAYRDFGRKQKHEVSLDYLMSETSFEPFATDNYFEQYVYEKQTVFVVQGKEVVVTSRRLADALANLSEQRRTVLLMNFFLGYSERKIGNEYGRSRSTVNYWKLAALKQLRKELEEMSAYVNVGECLIEESETEDVDWVNNWKQYFHQFYVDDVLIIPSWEEVKPEDEDKMIIHIDPGTAFGTGMHETTQLCIRQIRKYVTENTKILDVGCGSGILGMLALKFGAKYSVGTDLDPCAIDATHENMEVNGISKDRYEVMIGNIIDDKEVQDKVGYECYDIVAANILADVLVALTPVVVNQIKKGGIYITSGIIDDKEETVVEAVKKAGLEVLDITYQGEWVCVTARKN